MPIITEFVLQNLIVVLILVALKPSYRTNCLSPPSTPLQYNSAPKENQYFMSIADTTQHGQLSTFFGVIIPCTLSMFSIILFLRVGYFIGQVREQITCMT